MTYYYLDTSIWMDFYEKRGKHGEYILLFLKKLLQSTDIVLVSDILIKELKSLYLSMEQIHNTFRVLRPNHIRYIFTTKSLRDESRNLTTRKKIPYSDALHALLSRDYEAILLSRDHDFAQLSSITHARLPEEFL